MDAKATKETFIPYENGKGPRYVQIPKGEEYILGEEGIHIITDMAEKEVKKLVKAEGVEPRCESSDMTYMPNGIAFTSFDAAIFNPNGTEIIQHNREGLYITRPRIIAEREKPRLRRR